MISKKYFLLLFFLFLSISMLFGQLALASQTSLQISPLQDRLAVGQTFAVGLWVKTGGYQIGRLTATISFPEDYLEVVSFKLADFVSSTGKNYYDNQKGYIYVQASVSGGVQQDASWAEIVFKVKQKGSAWVELLKNAQVFTNHGWQVPIQLAGSRYQLLPVEQVTKEEKVVYQETEEGGLGGIKNSLIKDSVLAGQPPVLKGKTDVAGARIEFEVDHGLLTDRVVANGDGEWEWYMPKLVPGIYAVKITATHPQDKQKRYVEWVEVEAKVIDASKSLYKVEVVTSTALRGQVGKSFSFSIKIFDTVGQEKKIEQNKVNFDLSYYIEDPSKSIIYEDKEIVNYTDSDIVLNKSVVIPTYSNKGEYTLYVSLKMADELIHMDIVNFKVSGSRLAYYLAGALFIVLLTSFGAILRHRRVEIVRKS